MADQLTAKEAYFAALEDVKHAEFFARSRVKAGAAREDFERLLREDLEQRWQRRIERGELPPLTPELQKAS